MNPPHTSLSASIMAWAAMTIALVVAGYTYVRDRGEQRPTGTTSVLQRVSGSNQLRAGFIVNSPQVSRDAKTSELSGYHYDLLKKLATEGGFEVAFEETTFSTMVAALNSHNVDVVIGGGSESIPRAMEVSFTDPIMILGLGYIARSDDPRFQSVADLSRPGIKVAVTAGGASAEYQKEYMPQAEPVILARSELARIVLEVTSGRADIGIGNVNNCLRFEKEQPNIRFVTKGKPFYRFTSGFVVRHGDPEWLQFLNSSIRNLQTNGFTDRLEAKYNPDGMLWTPIKLPR